MNRADLLTGMAELLKGEIAPAVSDAYPKTQAYLGAVVLQKIAAELRLAEVHGQAEAAERKTLLADLEPELRDAPDAVTTAYAALRTGGDAELCAFIQTLYANRDGLGRDRFDALLGRVRQDLRRSIDRRMEIAS
ncbi:MAG: hypothetical protein P1U49_01150 [Minwuia sp.]|nr:hypothetical protein [Minwuia sp.]